MPNQGDRNITNSPKTQLSLDMSPSLIPSVSSLDSRSLSTFHYSTSLPTDSTPENDNAPAPKNTPQFSLDSNLPLAIYAKRKYKPVAQKVRPIATSLPDRFRIRRDISGDPLAAIPTILPNPPPFSPTGRYTQERYDFIEKAHPTDFLWPAERALMHHFMCLQNQGFAWDDAERGRFRDDFFPPVEMPVVDHKPWVLRNIPIPPGIYDEVCRVIRRKLTAGVYEPSNSSYRSRWFCVVKKDGTSLRLVHSLEPLNAVTIQHSGVPPFTDLLAEQFAGRVCGASLDLYVGYDERALAESSRDFTTFQSPFGALRLVTLPMGWTNSVPIFHEDVTHILQPEIPHVTVPFIDDVPIKGPDSDYRQPDGSFETIAENPGIRRFVWEHFQNVNRVVQRMKYAGGTFSGFKAVLCAQEFSVVGHRCTPRGRIPDDSFIAKISAWGPCQDLSDVRAFLGTVGVLRIFIRNFAHRAHALTMLTRKLQPFVFGADQLAAQEDLKQAVLTSPALRPIDYTSDSPVILSVDTSYIAVGFILSQADADDIKRRHFARFGSITLNDRESRFSQPKLEIYGLFRALRALKLYLIGVRNLTVEVDARYIKGMLSNPDIAPSASINRWIISILAFHFTLVHVPGIAHGPDGLSRRPAQPGDIPEEDDEEAFDDWIDKFYGFAHFINPIRAITLPHLPLPATTSTAALLFNAESDAHARSSSQPEPEPDPAPPVTPPRNYAAIRQDNRLLAVRLWLDTLRRPPDLDDVQYTRFLRYCAEFFVASNKLWRKNAQGHHKLVLFPELRLSTLRSAHDDLGHKGFYATRALLAERFWWPQLSRDVIWFVRTCHLCQVRQNTRYSYPAYCRNPRAVIRQNVHGFHAHATCWRLPLYCAGTLFAYALSRVSHAPGRIC
jgi:Integrase zinc binding domain/RNase H-like domain found in reverse transcriptase